MTTRRGRTIAEVLYPTPETAAETVRVVAEVGHLAADLMEAVHARIHGLAAGNVTVNEEHIRQKLKLLRYRYRQLTAVFGEPEEDPPARPGVWYESSPGSMTSIRTIDDPEDGSSE